MARLVTHGLRLDLRHRCAVPCQTRDCLEVWKDCVLFLVAFNYFAYTGAVSSRSKRTDR